MRWQLAAALALLLMAAGQASAQERDSLFAGLAWGDPPEALGEQGMYWGDPASPWNRFLLMEAVDPIPGGQRLPRSEWLTEEERLSYAVLTYVRGDDPMRVGDLRIDGILYQFMEDRLIGVRVVSLDQARLREVAISRFGPSAGLEWEEDGAVIRLVTGRRLAYLEYRDAAAWEEREERMAELREIAESRYQDALAEEAAFF